jgi:hypothetical protein
MVHEGEILYVNDWGLSRHASQMTADEFATGRAHWRFCSSSFWRTPPSRACITTLFLKRSQSGEAISNWSQAVVASPPSTNEQSFQTHDCSDFELGARSVTLRTALLRPRFAPVWNALPV